MSDTDSTNPTSSTDPLKLIAKAGKLNYSIERTVSIVRSHFPDYSENTLYDLLNTPGSSEYDAYHTGKESGMFDVESGLYNAAAEGDADAQKALQNLRQERNVGESIRKRFFPDE